MAQRSCRRNPLGRRKEGGSRVPPWVARPEGRPRTYWREDGKTSPSNDPAVLARVFDEINGSAASGNLTPLFFLWRRLRPRERQAKEAEENEVPEKTADLSLVQFFSPSVTERGKKLKGGNVRITGAKSKLYFLRLCFFLMWHFCLL